MFLEETSQTQNRFKNCENPIYFKITSNEFRLFTGFFSLRFQCNACFGAKQVKSIEPVFLTLINGIFSVTKTVYIGFNNPLETNVWQKYGIITDVWSPEIAFKR